jgi:2-C-methyl-D-erythritol 4-phosphate cytidylyltransferase
VSAWAVLVAAGRGERLGGDRPKAFAKLRDRPLLAESLERLENSDWIDAIVIVAPRGWEEPSTLVAEELACSKVVATVGGGETRAESVRAGLAEVDEGATVVLVHDAARPALPEEVIQRVLEALNEGWDGAVPALPPADTLKRVSGRQVVETLPREELAAAQTPQAFLAPVLREAFAGDVAGATDCSAVVEAHGGRVTTVHGDRRLLKVTEPADLEMVAAFL